MDADTLQSFKRSSNTISSLYMWCWFWTLYCFSPPENLFKAKSLWEAILCGWQVQPENRITGSSLLWALFQRILHQQCEPSLTAAEQPTFLCCFVKWIQGAQLLTGLSLYHLCVQLSQISSISSKLLISKTPIRHYVAFTIEREVKFIW